MSRYIVVEEYLRHHLSNPKRKLPTIVARGYNNPDHKGNMVAMKENGMEISWFKNQPYFVISYCVPTTIKESPFYELKKDVLVLEDQFDEKSVADWNRFILDADNEIHKWLMDTAKQNRLNREEHY